MCMWLVGSATPWRVGEEESVCAVNEGDCFYRAQEVCSATVHETDLHVDTLEGG
jgi:hypothetical protein